MALLNEASLDSNVSVDCQPTCTDNDVSIEMSKATDVTQETHDELSEGDHDNEVEKDNKDEDNEDVKNISQVPHEPSSHLDVDDKKHEENHNEEASKETQKDMVPNDQNHDSSTPSADSSLCPGDKEQALTGKATGDDSAIVSSPSDEENCEEEKEKEVAHLSADGASSASSPTQQRHREAEEEKKEDDHGGYANLPRIPKLVTTEQHSSTGVDSEGVTTTEVSVPQVEEQNQSSDSVVAKGTVAKAKEHGMSAATNSVSEAAQKGKVSKFVKPFPNPSKSPTQSDKAPVVLKDKMHSPPVSVSLSPMRSSAVLGKFSEPVLKEKINNPTREHQGQSHSAAGMDKFSQPVLKDKIKTPIRDYQGQAHSAAGVDKFSDPVLKVKVHNPEKGYQGQAHSAAGMDKFSQPVLKDKVKTPVKNYTGQKHSATGMDGFTKPQIRGSVRNSVVSRNDWGKNSPTTTDKKFKWAKAGGSWSKQQEE